MATSILLNTVNVGTQVFYAGSEVDSTYDDVLTIQASGGRLWSSSDPAVDAAAALCRKKIALGEMDNIDSLMQAAVCSLMSPFVRPDGDITLLSVGDSIASGSLHPGGFLGQLQRFARYNGVPIRAVGPVSVPNIVSTTDMRPEPYDPFCAGYPGEFVSQILARWQTGGTIANYIATYGAPDVVVLASGGTNDISALGSEATTVWVQTQLLIARVRALCPNAVILVCSIPFFYSPVAPTGGLTIANARVSAYNALLAANVAAQTTSCYFVDVAADYGRGEIGPDGVHPLPHGYARAAQRIYDFLKSTIFPSAGLADRAMPRSFRPRTRQASPVFSTNITTDSLATTADDGWRWPAGNFLFSMRLRLTSLPTTLITLAQATPSGQNYQQGWMLALDGSSSPKTLNFYGGGGPPLVFAQSPLLAGKPYWIFAHADRATGTASIWLGQQESINIANSPWVVACIMRASGITAWGAGLANAILTMGKNLNFSGFLGEFDNVAVAQGAAVPGFNDIRPVLEAMMYEGIQCPGTTARLPCNEGSGATCASATAGTNGTLVASTWTAAGTIAWPSDY